MSRVGDNNIRNLIYANDTVLIVDSEEKMQNVLTAVTIESENTEIKKKIALSIDTFTKMTSIFTNRNIRFYTKSTL